jgi:hypothetical protein
VLPRVFEVCFDGQDERSVLSITQPQSPDRTAPHHGFVYGARTAFLKFEKGVFPLDIYFRPHLQPPLNMTIVKTEPTRKTEEHGYLINRKNAP